MDHLFEFLLLVLDNCQLLGIHLYLLVSSTEDILGPLKLKLLLGDKHLCCIGASLLILEALLTALEVNDKLLLLLFDIHFLNLHLVEFDLKLLDLHPLSAAFLLEMFDLPSVSPRLTISVVNHLLHCFEVRARSLVVTHELIKLCLQLIELELRDRFQKFWVPGG